MTRLTSTKLELIVLLYNDYITCSSNVVICITLKSHGNSCKLVSWEKLNIVFLCFHIVKNMILYLWRMLYCVYFQKEYYATHQLFLTHRALYLAIWKLTDGEEGVRNLHFWLLNIQVCLATVIKQLCANLNICRQKPSGKVMTLSLGRTYVWWCPITMSSMWFKKQI